MVFMNSGEVLLPQPWRECPIGNMQAWGACLSEGAPVPPLSSLIIDKQAGGEIVGLENIDTGMRLILRLMPDAAPHTQRPTLAIEYHAVAVVLLSHGSGGVRGADLRDVPLAAICAAYSARDAAERIRFNRTARLDFPASQGIPKKYWDEDVDGEMDTVYPPTNILDPLPAKCSKRPWFYALVAEQYDALAREHPDANVANLMVELNSDVAPGSVRRWITRARKEGLLPPADWKRG